MDVYFCIKLQLRDSFLELIQKIANTKTKREGKRVIFQRSFCKEQSSLTRARLRDVIYTV